MKKKNRPRWRTWGRRLGYVAAALGVLVIALVLVGWKKFGKGASGERLARMQASKQWTGDGFENGIPLWNDYWGWLSSDYSDYGSPEEALPVVTPDPAMFDEPPESGLRVTWLGHSTTLIEIDGHRLLTDPIWGEFVGPFPVVGPTRWYPAPIALSDMPKVDAVLISHDHYDHLDTPTIEQIRDWDTKFIAPLGVGAHLAYWGVPEERIVEVDWWDTLKVGELEVVCTPARHASGRHLFDQNHTLWASYALIGDEHRVYFSGDTGMFPELTDIGDKYGPFDIAMIEVGAYHWSWPDWHMGPEQAVTAHQMVRGKRLLPIHWGLFNLALHGWTEPIERTVRAAEAQEVDVATPRPGESIEAASPPIARWWPEVPWENAEQHPIEATGIAAVAAQP